MLTCIPTKGQDGLEDTISDHFGSTKYFTLVDTESGDVTILENRNEHHAHGTCHPMAQLSRHKIDCVACLGMGRRAIEALNSEGIRTLQAPSPHVKDVVSSIKDGRIADMDASQACRGHGQKQGGCAHTGTSPDGPPHGQGRGGGHQRGSGGHN